MVSPYLARTEGIGISKVEAEPPALPHVLPYMLLFHDSGGLRNHQRRIATQSAFPHRASKRRDWGNCVDASIIPVVRIKWPSQTLREQVAGIQFSYLRWFPRHHSTTGDSCTAGMLPKTGPLLIKRFVLREKQGNAQTFWVAKAAMPVKNSERGPREFLFHAAWKFMVQEVLSKLLHHITGCSSEPTSFALLSIYHAI